MSVEHVDVGFPATLLTHHRAVLAAARPLLSRVVALGTYQELYSRERTAGGDTFCERALNTLDIDIDVTSGDLLQIPQEGPLIVVANHPHGLLDGLVIGRVVERRRRDVRILTNHLISPLPGRSALVPF